MKKTVCILMAAAFLLSAGCSGVEPTAKAVVSTDSASDEKNAVSGDVGEEDKSSEALDERNGTARASAESSAPDREKRDAYHGEAVSDEFFVSTEDPKTVTNTIPEDIRTMAHEMPEASYKKLPAWHGTHLNNKYERGFSPMELIPCEFTEEVIDEVEQCGFNFIRIPLDTRIFFSREQVNTGFDFDGTDENMNLKELANLDDLISWCIERKIHVCLDVHNTPGGLMIGGDEEASREELMEKDSSSQKTLIKFWSILAKRYADVSTNALSFNLYNEPPTFATEEQYVYLMNRIIDAVREASPDRLIFVDMLDYSSLPIYSLTDKEVVQCFHCYRPSQFTSANTDVLTMQGTIAKPALVSYPVPFVNPDLSNKADYTLHGDFPKDTLLEIMLSDGSMDGELSVWADGVSVFSMEITPEFFEEKGYRIFEDGSPHFSYWQQYGEVEPIIVSCTLEQPAQKLEIRYRNPNGGWFCVNDVYLNTPNYRVKFPPSETNGAPGLPATDLIIDEKGFATSNAGLPEYELGSDYIEDLIRVYADFSEETGVPVMLQEFGDHKHADIGCSVRFHEDVFAACEKFHIPWCQYSFDSGDFSLVAIDPFFRRINATYEEIGPDRYVAKELLEAIQRHMK